MQFFYIDYMNGNKKERNIGFLRPDKEGLHVGLRGVPAQCGSACSVYVLKPGGERCLLGRVPVKNGYGMEKLGWTREAGLEECVGVEIPLYGARVGRCIIRETAAPRQDKTSRQEQTPWQGQMSRQGQTPQQGQMPWPGQMPRPGQTPQIEQTGAEPSSDRSAAQTEQTRRIREEAGYRRPIEEEMVAESIPDKWTQLLNTYPQVHILPEAQSILIKPKDVIILTEKYHDLAANSFVLHAYYNYRQLLLFHYIRGEAGAAAYYIGVPGVYHERECRIAEMFGFEGFENGEARMRVEEERENALHNGCFGYYMKQVEI
ncbi:MAG: DUF6128 domain-containing protein [Roseburia sp.]|nr:DUF6128 domain-containing protein [Roseburia sp.]